ncbi:unnamed protein product [[Actinomadura] parvosata subsp. kistnae]|uniref:Uncharacterized protein n=1 Tax=[Actinomadura] parvosata subsp. kistnae TaxID=1909395 RepID=A0A1V0AAQ9_9ACTN|nr:hypothetical protein [Nonomuraea sp. ATCC 55076]AQZ67232.1 hypothetical protein BKM31_42430 [Nonomuraea sp. ATCC 55076]SPL94553.1 unnamed protein product [Actinomadura parvosata subsp. kistnae]
MADQVNATPTGIAERLTCDEARVRRWEAGEVRWPRTPYRLALTQLTGLEPEALGFSQTKQTGSGLIEARVIPADALRAEADLYGTVELAQQLQASDVESGTLEALAEASISCAGLTLSYPRAPYETERKSAWRRSTTCLPDASPWTSIANCS